jgi:hypothetical protein
MCKVITLRLQDKEYKKISSAAEIEHRPISNFITTTVLKDIEESYYVDSIEMAQINSDKRLQGKLRAGHRDARRKKGKFVG